VISDLLQVFNNYPNGLFKIYHFSSSDCVIISNREGPETYSQTDTGNTCPTCGAGLGEKCELTTGQPRKTPHRDRR